MSLERGLELAGMLYGGATVTSKTIVTRFGVSKATAKRDMNAIESTLPVTASKDRYGVHLRIMQRWQS
jgi:predicted DNA-binding transcriptional regulator YafY